MELAEPEIDIKAQEVILAAAHHDLTRLRTLLRNTPATVQDGETGYTPLHAAIAACTPDDTSAVNGDQKQINSSEQAEDIEAAEKTLKLLLQNGAIWNDLDKNGETPGCMAWRLKLLPLYEVMVDAGVRAELLLGRLDEYDMLQDNEDDDEEDDDAADIDEEADRLQEQQCEEVKGDTRGDSKVSGLDIVIEPPAENGIDGSDPSANNADYLKSSLSISGSRILDSAQNGVMMDWERAIMRRTATLLLPTIGLTVLNIGHGMGIIDDYIQGQSPSKHYIIEAHPQVLKKMKESGWMDKPNVVILEGRWQDALPRLVNEGNITFDAIYFDTFAEDYKAFRNFFEEYVIALLKSDGIWGFFHGLGADRQVCYDVYTKVVEMDLFEAGFDVEWEDVDVPDLQQTGEWNGVRRSYWRAEKYRLPICKFVG